jgi:phospholipid/cholesterol/gamma-HCH transport system substrate-binding protein
MGMLWEKPKIMMMLAGGDTIKAEFANSYRLVPHDSTVKISGLEVGQVTKISYTSSGTAEVSMKVDRDALRTLGSSPTARIEPRTVLGGRYVVELRPGGKGTFGGTIPLSRTGEPVELDRVLESLPSSTREALQGLVGSSGPALGNSKKELGDLLHTAPQILPPGTDVVTAAQGEHPDKDLERLVSNLSETAGVLTDTDGQLSAIMQNLHATATTLADHKSAVAETIAHLPETIHSAHGGIRGLDDSVVRLQTTARDLEPATPELSNVVARLQPLLNDAQPVLAELQPLLQSARPTVQQLVPVAKEATGVLQDLHGPVLDRVNGPIANFVLDPWTGTGPYAGSTDNYMKGVPLYQELAYMAANIDHTSMTQDSRGSALALQVSVGADLLQFGTPLDLQDVLNLALKTNGISDPAVKKAVMKKAGVTR